MSSHNPNQLLVEGADDLYAVVNLMAAHIDWPDNKHLAPVHITPLGSPDQVLEPTALGVQVKTATLKALGVMIDADLNAAGRYRKAVSALRSHFPDLPESTTENGVIATNTDGKRVGIWVMPDNVSEGYLEVFLRYLVPDQQEPLWRHAVESTTLAKERGAGVKDGHLGKAHLYTWLSWQDEPGRSPGLALTQKILDPHAPYAMPFVNWFRNLYGL